jgi:hypothetical protein
MQLRFLFYLCTVLAESKNGIMLQNPFMGLNLKLSLGMALLQYTQAL